jgi:hypothetical protein
VIYCEGPAWPGAAADLGAAAAQRAALRLETTILLVPNQRSKNPKCLIWCRFGAENRHYSPLDCPYVVRKELNSRNLTQCCTECY